MKRRVEGLYGAFAAGLTGSALSVIRGFILPRPLRQARAAEGVGEAKCALESAAVKFYIERVAPLVP